MIYKFNDIREMRKNIKKDDILHKTFFLNRWRFIELQLQNPCTYCIDNSIE